MAVPDLPSVPRKSSGSRGGCSGWPIASASTGCVSRVILPTAEFFSNDYSGSDEDARDCFQRGCGYMGIDPGTINMVIGSDGTCKTLPACTIRVNAQVIWIRESQLVDPPSLSARCHELAHELLLKGERLTGEDQDHELVTDCCPCSSASGFPGERHRPVRRRIVKATHMRVGCPSKGYLSSLVLGYGLTVFAYIRGERKPPWHVHLRTDARLTLDAGLRYLWKTGDCLFKPAMEKYHVPYSDMKIAAAIAHRTRRFGSSGYGNDLNNPAIRRIFFRRRTLPRRPDPDVRCAAISAMGSFGATAIPALQQLSRRRGTQSREIRYAAMSASKVGRNESEECVYMARIVSDDDPKAARAAADAVALGTLAQPAEERRVALKPSVQRSRSRTVDCMESWPRL